MYYTLHCIHMSSAQSHVVTRGSRQHSDMLTPVTGQKPEPRFACPVRKYMCLCLCVPVSSHVHASGFLSLLALGALQLSTIINYY